ncbi:MAG TPA: Fe-S cluster assembly protein NifU [Acidobacteriota bacterium]|nr:Fe-S cluster assembly protein NifU [Acidobacteriota bacterium]
MWDYSDKVKDHFFNPRNVGEISNPDAWAEVGSLACGDALKLMLRIGADGRIIDAKFKTFGCGSAIASSSALTEMIIGKTVEEASKVSNQDIAEFLDGLPEEKMHCSVMGMEALEKALARYRGERVPEDDEEEGYRIVCHCFGVTDAKIKRVVRENRLTKAEQVTYYSKAGGGCGSCIPEIEDLIAEVWQEEGMSEEPVKAAKPAKMTNIEKMKLIMQTIDEEIRPTLQKDGGDIELIDIDGSNVLVSLRGNCASCKVAEFTLSLFVQQKLREMVSDDIVVEEVPE